MPITYVHGEPQPLPDDGAFDEFLDPASCAVVSVDMHRGHLDDSPECPCPAPRARAIVEPVDRFHSAARAHGIRVIHVRSILRAGGEDDVGGYPSAWRVTFPRFVGAIPNAAEHALEGSRWTEFVTEIDQSDLLVDGKKRLSPFYMTDLELLLRNLKVRTVVFDGGMTDCCILNAAFDAANRDFRVVVPHELVAGTTPELEQAALDMISIHLGLVIDTDELLNAWDERRADT